MAIVTDTVAVQRFAMGLFGVQVGTVTMNQVDKQIDRTTLGATLNSYYASAFGAQTTAAVAATLVANLGITGAGVANAVTYVTAKLNAAAPAARGEEISNIINMFSGLTGDATYGAAAQTWNANVDAAAAYTGAANVAFGAVISQSLTGGLDTLFGSALADMFTADLSNGGNTLQGGDRIDGGAGNDTLKAILGSMGEDKAITAQTSGIEKVIIQAQSRNYDSGDNNVTNESIVNVDAARMSGVNNWENSNSRADLIVEDVRIADNQITKDITITMRETDPGHVDFAVYFDQNSLRNASASSSQINLQVMDTRAVVDGKAPLLNSPYGGFKFTATDSKGVATVVTLQSDAIDAAQTYAELAVAFQAAADKQFGAGAVTVSIGSDFTVTDTTTAQSVTGKEVVIKTTSAYSFTTPAGSGWVAAGVVPANSGLHTNFSQGSTTSTDLVTSTIVLDDVGRGSTGGDLVIGGLSVGETSTSKGVQRFNITIEDNSKLETINSTNNTLREVSIVNGSTSRVNNAYNDNVKDAGNLTVTGTVVGPVADNGNNSTSDNRLPGLNTVEHGAFGFTDVRLIDASTFKGKLDLDAQLTDRVTTKYMTLTDAPAAAAADNVNFDYLMGTNNDTFSLDISAANLATAGTTTREDFVLNIAGNAGNDKLTASIARDDAGNPVDAVPPTTGTAEIPGFFKDPAKPLAAEWTPAVPAVPGNPAKPAIPSGPAQGWYDNSKLNANLNINGGEGNDTITTKLAGDWKVVGGAGNDVVYDNVDAGANAKWVLNNITPVTPGQTNIESMKNDKNFFSGVDVSVTFKHITKTVKVSSTDGFTTDLQINQAIKDAINNDATLKNLLEAKDGPANSLVVTSLVDGAVMGDLNVAFARTTAILSNTEAETIGAAYKAAYLAIGIDPASAGLNTTVATPGQVMAIMDAHIKTLTQAVTAGAAIEAYTDGADYNVQTNFPEYFTKEEVKGGNKGDSTFTLGTDDDILVLDANSASGDKVVYSAGEQFGNDTIINFEVNTRAANALVFSNVDKLDFSALGGDMNAANAVNYVPASTNGDVAINFANLATAQTLVDAGVTYGVVGTFATQTTGGNAAGTAGYFATPTAGTNQDSVTVASVLSNGAAQANKSIVIMDLDEWLNTNSVNDTAAEVASFFDNLVATTHIAIVVDKHNVGSVYAVTDGTGAADATATLMGTIDLGSTQWNTLTADNFV